MTDTHLWSVLIFIPCVLVSLTNWLWSRTMREMESDASACGRCLTYTHGIWLFMREPVTRLSASVCVRAYYLILNKPSKDARAQGGGPERATSLAYAQYWKRVTVTDVCRVKSDGTVGVERTNPSAPSRFMHKSLQNCVL